MDTVLVRHAPDPALRGAVRGYWDFEQRADGPVQTRETPTAGLVVIIDLEAGWTVQGERFGSFAAGLTDGPTTVRHEGTARAIQVDLSPLAGRALLGVPGGELAGQPAELGDLVGGEAGFLVERLAEAPGTAARAAIVDAALLRRLRQASGAAAAPVAPDVARAWNLLQRSRGRLRVEALAAELRCSRRHLARRFAAEVGLGPKAVGRILRLEHAQALWHRAPLAEVAAGAGYADQAHLSREVQVLTGRSPAALRAERAGMQPVPNVQDTLADAL